MSIKRKIKFGVIGCGLMGREFASAVARWCHLNNLNFEPEIIAACDTHAQTLEWFERQVPTLKQATDDYRKLLENTEVEAVYCAVPHNLHEQIYLDILRAGKHLLGEKPFGIDRQASEIITQAIQANPHLLVRCSSEFPFFPGAFRIGQWIREKRFGKIIEVEAGCWHSSDLDPQKPINWKRQIEINGELGVMGDLGFHVLHLPLRFGWQPQNVRALLSNIITERPDATGGMVACETWDNAILSTEAESEGAIFPMILSMKRIAPGHANTWFIRVLGTEFSAEFSTKNPKELKSMPYSSGKEQAWHCFDVPHVSAYSVITGNIFEFDFSGSILQMWAAFCDELVNGREKMKQPFYCATPEEVAASHDLFNAALESHRTKQTIQVRQALSKTGETSTADYRN